MKCRNVLFHDYAIQMGRAVNDCCEYDIKKVLYYNFWRFFLSARVKKTARFLSFAGIFACSDHIHGECEDFVPLYKSCESGQDAGGCQNYHGP